MWLVKLFPCGQKLTSSPPTSVPESAMPDTVTSETQGDLPNMENKRSTEMRPEAQVEDEEDWMSKKQKTDDETDDGMCDLAYAMPSNINNMKSTIESLKTKEKELRSRFKVGQLFTVKWVDRSTGGGMPASIQVTPKRHLSPDEFQSVIDECVKPIVGANLPRAWRGASIDGYHDFHSELRVAKNPSMDEMKQKRDAKRERDQQYKEKVQKFHNEIDMFLPPTEKWWGLPMMPKWTDEDTLEWAEMNKSKSKQRFFRVWIPGSIVLNTSDTCIKMDMLSVDQVEKLKNAKCIAIIAVIDNHKRELNTDDIKRLKQSTSYEIFTEHRSNLWKREDYDSDDY